MKNRLLSLHCLWPIVCCTVVLAQTAEDYVNAGRKKSLAGDLNAAIADFNHALEAAPKSVPAYSGCGLAKRRKGDLDGAIADLSVALEIDPKSVLALSDRGFCRMNLGDLDGAFADFTRAAELSADSADRRNSLGIVKQLKGDFRGAIADYDRAIELKPDAPTYPRIYRELLARRTGKPTTDFGKTVAAWKDGWPKTVGQFVAGSLDEAGFVAAAMKGDEKGGARATMPRLLFRGHDAPDRGQPGRRARGFRAVTRDGIEYLQRIHPRSGGTCVARRRSPEIAPRASAARQDQPGIQGTALGALRAHEPLGLIFRHRRPPRSGRKLAGECSLSLPRADACIGRCRLVAGPRWCPFSPR